MFSPRCYVKKTLGGFEMIPKEVQALKTLKDIPAVDLSDEIPVLKERFISEISIKAETIKWIKEDIEIIESYIPNNKPPALIILGKWMRRLNVTEEDLR